MLVVFNKHNTARVASCWFIIYYIINISGLLQGLVSDDTTVNGKFTVTVVL